MTIFICNTCGWTGTESDLSTFSSNPDDQKFEYCPHCHGDDFEIVEDPEDVPDMRR